MSTGQIVGGVIGAVIGTIAGGNTMLGAQLGMMVGGALDPPKGKDTSGPRLSDLTIQTSTYGANIPRPYGTAPIDGNIFWLKGNKIDEIPVKKKTGGKGGSKATNTTWVNYATFAVGLGRGPIVGIRRIRIKGELYYDAGSSDMTTIVASNSVANGFTLYLGTDTQMPDPMIVADKGAGNVPAYRGLAYIVFTNLALAKYGDTLAGAQVQVEVVASGAVDSQVPVVQSRAYEDRWFESGPWFDSQASNFYALFYKNTLERSIATSRDMLQWVETEICTLPFEGHSCCFRYANLYCIASANVIKISSNLTSWSTAYYWTYFTWNWGWSLNFNGGVLLVEYAQGSNPQYPSSLLSCFITDLAIEGTYGFMSGSFTVTCPLAYNGGVVMAAGMLGSTPHVYTSATGIGNWDSKTVPSGVTDLYGVCAFGSSFLLFGYDSLSATGKSTITTDDGASWTAWTNLPSAPASIYLPYPSSHWVSPSWNGTSFAAAHVANRYWLTSLDGFNWTSTALVGPGTESLSGQTKVWDGSSWGAVKGHYAFKVGSPSVRIESTSPLLSSIVLSECLKPGLLTSGDIVATALTPSVRGYVVGSSGTIRSALEPLQAAWPFDIVQRGYKLYFIMRGGSSVATIAAADLDARQSGQSVGVQITTGVEGDTQLPRKVTVKHLDYDRDYEIGEQYAERYNTAAISEQTLDLPIVMTATEAAGKAEVLLYLYWMERFDVAVTVPSTYNNLEPADVVTLTTPDGPVTIRIVGVNYTSDDRVEIKAKYANAAVYTPTAVGSYSAVAGPSTILSAGKSSYVLLDVPYMHPAQTDPSMLAAMYGSSGWPGGVLMRTDDSGTTWTDLQGFSSPGGTVGHTTNSIGVVDSRVWDKGSSLLVTMSNGDLSSASELAVLNGMNSFAYGAPGRWEIIGVQNCSLVSSDTYRLYDMLRGQYGTEWAMGTHGVGDYVVLLSDSDVSVIGLSVSSIGLSREYRGITLDQTIDTDIDYPFTYTGVNLKCLSPVYFTGYRLASTDWAMTWVPRSRTDGEWRDDVDAGLGETSEAYEVDIFTDNTFTTVKRTIPSSTPTCTYTSAQQVADFGAARTVLYVKVYQLSSVVGRGYPTTATLS